MIGLRAADYHAERPSLHGWWARRDEHTPAGRVLPCHAAETLPGSTFPRCATVRSPRSGGIHRCFAVSADRLEPDPALLRAT